MAHDALGAHARDELGTTESTVAKPLQAALASACSFAVGAALPLLTTTFVPTENLIAFVIATSLVALAFFSGLAAKTGGAKIFPGVLRITF